ncbi:hypothetical protein MPL3365_80052 [Mesorhizobium plurifarium]|uniref:Uncharacterized protein n=1 Tax=Mesorhizobium plurifarium TaxID=69974 RepID=A0A090GHS0_MESPL|nr:hypothetical protein MPL3365_80052 [Mesorhizobium plurifarium]
MGKLGDVVLNRQPQKTAPGPDRFDLLGAVAARYGVEVSELLERMASNDVLARICRDVLGFNDLEPAARKRGPKFKHQELLAFAITVRQNDPTASCLEISRQWVVAKDGMKNLRPDLLKARIIAKDKLLRGYAERFGGSFPDISPLAALYVADLPSET